MKSYKLHPTDAVYWTVDKRGHSRGFADIHQTVDVPAMQIEDFNDLIKARTIKSELLRMMYDTQK